MTRFSNNLHQVGSKSKAWKTEKKNWEQKANGINRIVKIC